MATSIEELKDTETKRVDDEREELYRLRDAAWESQHHSGKTGTCEFLRLLLDLHKEIALLNGLESPKQSPPKAAHETPPTGFGATHEEKGGRKKV